MYYRKADLMKKSKSTKSYDQYENRSQIIDQIPRRRLWIFRLVALIVIPIVFFSLLELTLRLFHFGYPTTALVETKTNTTDYVHDNPAFGIEFLFYVAAQAISAGLEHKIRCPGNPRAFRPGR